MSEPKWSPIVGPMRDGETRYRDLPILKRCIDCGAPLEWFEVMTHVRDGRAVTPLCLPCCASSVPATESGQA